MARPRFAYRLGWRSIRTVAGMSGGHWRISAAQARALADGLGPAMHNHGINTARRAAAFIGQVAHESAGFTATTEFASGAAYEGRRDLGNTHPGDGRRFRGRGLIMVTGRANYAAASKALGVDFIAHPEKLAEPRYAAAVSAWWWQAHGCNELADAGSLEALTRRINGGLNGLESRRTYTNRARRLSAFLTPRRRPPT